MIAAATVRPTPLPTPWGSNPGTWQGRDLASMTYTYASNAARTKEQVVHCTTVASPLGQSECGSWKRPASNEAAFQPIQAASFADAVEAASQLSSERRIGHGGYLAIGLMQAGDGAWYATALRNADSFNSWCSMDNGSWVTDTDATRLHPDLKAVVGRSSWINFTDEQVQPKLVG